mgnify:CR=1 FL=1
MSEMIWYKNENTYGDAITIKVRLHSLITGKYHDIFNFNNYVTDEEYLKAIQNLKHS